MKFDNNNSKLLPRRRKTTLTKRVLKDVNNFRPTGQHITNNTSKAPHEATYNKFQKVIFNQYECVHGRV